MWLKVPGEEEWEYHPGNWQMLGKEDSYPNITESMLEKMNAVRLELEKSGYWDEFDDSYHDNDNNEPVFPKLLRFMRAQKWDVPKIIALIKNDIGWRREQDIATIRFEYPNTILGCDYATQLFQYYPTWIQGFDKQERPVTYKRFGNIDLAKILKETDMESFLRFHAYETEMSLRVANYSSLKNHCNIEQIVIVIDCAGWGLHLATNEAVEFMKGITSIDNTHYPERLGQMLLINAPWTLSGVWSIIKTLLDPVTSAKVQIISNESTWKEKLFEIVDRSQVPMSFGGDAPDLSPEEMALSFVIEGRSDAEKEKLTAMVQKHRYREYPHTKKEISGIRKKKKQKSKNDPDGTGITHLMKRSVRERSFENGLTKKNSSKGETARILKGFVNEAVRGGGSGALARLKLYKHRREEELDDAGDMGGVLLRYHDDPVPKAVKLQYPKPRTDGSVYEGGWLNGHYEGFGTLKFPNGSVYEGHFRKGHFHGRGKYIFTNMPTFQGRYGNRYEGWFRDGQFDDKNAQLHYLGGMVYCGGFKCGLREGPGRLTYTDGKIVEGKFKNDLCVYGTVEYLSHLKEHVVEGQKAISYEGGLHHGKRHGRGVVTFENGELLEGTFNMDQYQTPQDKLNSFLRDC